MGEAAAAKPGPEPGRLEALMTEAIAEIRKTGKLVMQDIRQRGDLAELMFTAGRLGAIEDELRNAAMFGVIQEQLKAVPDPEPAPRRRVPASVPGCRRPLMRLV